MKEGRVIITLQLPLIFVKRINQLTKGKHPLFFNRSELIREALREFLEKQLMFHTQIVEEAKDEDRYVMIPLEDGTFKKYTYEGEA